MFSKKILLLSILFISIRIYGQDAVVATFVMDGARLIPGGTPVSASLEGIDYNSDKGELRLFEVDGKTRTEVSCQLEPGNSPRLWWIPTGKNPDKSIRKFILINDSTFAAKK